ncbi:hypothetical protein EVA_04447 [gut metagenome]|uniref:Uncharacterized protein n=1 Tax=gut metagenome TaxID=749906 RepID=J9GIL7_9ZZZZ
METAFQSHDFLTAKTTEDQAAVMAFYRTYREIGDILIRKSFYYFDFCSEAS